MPYSHVTRIIAIRHGETAWNVDTRIQGHLDIPLNDTGRWQARRLAQALADETLDAIYASDLQRAWETARYVSEAVGVPVTAERGLRERGFGRFEGHTFKEIEERWPQEALRWRKRDIDFGPEGGETLRGFYERVVTTAARLAAAHRGQAIALVAHGGVLDCLYRAASRVDLHAPRTWELGNASINRLLHTEDGFTLVGWADTMHLADSARDEFSDGDRVGHAA
ncbi:MAG TPA: histidine phosphatase family protein [Burkholderiaceae bacterium]|nr:histidine phosphatase family protein [Burkholderiaceae bacterium]